MSTNLQDLQEHSQQLAITWRVVEVDGAEGRALVEPCFASDDLKGLLNERLGAQSWSQNYAYIKQEAVVGAVICTVGMFGSSRSELRSVKTLESIEESAEDCFVRCLEAFGIGPWLEQNRHWVDYNSEDGELLYEPEYHITPAQSPTSPIEISSPQKSPSDKPDGRQMIDKLIDRLRTEGQGLAVAKLLIEFGGYGANPDEARKLYTKLRELLHRSQDA